MAAGGPGDHPLLDITRYGLPTYGTTTDELIRKISNLCSPRELNEWWEKEIGWDPPQQAAHVRSKLRYAELLKRAKENGWEITAD